MWQLYYAGAAIGLFLLIADVGGALRVSARRVRLWRAVAAAVLVFIGLAPTVADLAGYLGSGSGLTGFALAYLAGATTYLIGIVAGDRPRAEWLRRAGYLPLLALAFLPSWVLIGFAPAIGLAGIGLVRPAGRDFTDTNQVGGR